MITDQFSGDFDLATDHQTHTTLAERIHSRLHMAKFTSPDMADDHYLLDAASVMPIIESLIAIAATAEQLLSCAAEFSKDIVCCSECFQAANGKVADLKKMVER